MKAYQIELEALKVLSHSHLVTVEGSYTDKKWLALLLSPVADLNLKQYLTRDGGIPAQEMANFKTYYGCLAHTLLYLRDHKIQHKDIKPENVLLKYGQDGFQLFLTDFGTAWNWAASGQSVSLPSNDDRKTPSYQSPEVARGTECHFSSDIWSLGVVYLEMTTVLRGRVFKDMGSFCTKNGTGNSTVWNNLEGALQWLDLIEPRPRQGFSDAGLRRWVRSMLVETPALRISVQALCEQIDDFTEDRYCCRCCSNEESSDNSDPSMDTYDPVDDAAGPTRDESPAVRLVDRLLHSQTGRPSTKEVTQKSGFVPFTVSFRDRKVQTAVTHSPVYVQYGTVDSISKHEQIIRKEVMNQANTGKRQEAHEHRKKHLLEALEPRLSDTSKIDHFFDSIEFVEQHDVLRDEMSAADLAATPAQRRPGPHAGGIRRETSFPSLRNSVQAEQQGYDDIMNSDIAASHVVRHLSDSALHAAFKISQDTLRQEFEELKEMAYKSRSKKHELDSSAGLVGSENDSKTPPAPRSPTKTSESPEKPRSPTFPKPPGFLGSISAAAQALQQSLSQARTPSAPGTNALTAANLRALPNTSGAIRPRKARSYRERLLNDVAQAAPTTVLSAATRDRLSTFKPVLHLNDRCYGFLERYTKLGKVAAVRYILEAGCNPGVKGNPRLAPLFNTIRGATERHTKCLLTLVEHKADTNPVRPSAKPSPLLVAVDNESWNQYAIVIYILLQAKADPNACDERKTIALVLLLLDSRPLSKERRDAVHFLLAPTYITDLSVQSPIKGDTPLHLAVRRRDPEILDAILEKMDLFKSKAEKLALINKPNKAGLTPLRLAYKVFHPTATEDRYRADQEEIVEVLLGNDADPNTTDPRESNTPLHVALSSTATSLGMIAPLLEQHANLYMQKQAGKTASSILIERMGEGGYEEFYTQIAVEVTKLHPKRLDIPDTKDTGADVTAAEECMCDICNTLRSMA